MNRASRSSPITINKPDINNTTEYCLKKNVFNPNKTSPPNSWNTRLMKRIAGSYELQTKPSILITK